MSSKEITREKEPDSQEFPETIEKLKSLGVDPSDAPEVLAVMAQVSEYQGPLPPANQFRIYEETFSGAAGRILDYMESQQAHRHIVEMKAIKSTGWETFRGQMFAFIVTLALVLSAFYCVSEGYPWVAVGFISVTMAGIVKKFIDGCNR